MPDCLKEAFGDQTLGFRAGDPAGVRRNTRFVDLRGEVIAGCSDAQLKILSREAATILARATSRLGVRIPEHPVPIEALDLTTRTRNGIIRAGVVTDGVITPTDLNVVKSWINFGGVAILEFAQETDRWLDSNEALQQLSLQPPVREELHAGEAWDPVSTMVRALAADEAAASITRGDFRLGQSLSAIHRHANCLADLAELFEADPFGFGTDAELAITKLSALEESVRKLRALRLEEEISTIISATGVIDGNALMLQARLGLNCDQPQTLEAAAVFAGVTRERARQVSNRFQASVTRSRRQWTPVLDRAITVVVRAGPSDVLAVQHQLREAGITAGEFPLQAVLRLARLFRVDMPAELDVFGSRLVTTKLPRELRRAPAVARRHVGRWGVMNIEELCLALFASEDGIQHEALVRDEVAEVEDIIWLDEDRSWFWFRGTEISNRNRLANSVDKIMSVAGALPLAELRDGVGRHHRMTGIRPPAPVLGAFCESTLRYEVRDDNWVVSVEHLLPDWNDLLGENERVLVDILFRHGPLMRKTDLIRRAVDEHGLKENSVQVYLTYSPVLRRFARGVWGIRGAQVSPAEVSALIPPRIRERVLDDHGWTAQGDPWVSYRVSRGTVSSSVLGLPSSLKSAVEGKFELRAGEQQGLGTLVAENGSVWGLSSMFRQLRVQPGDYLAFVFKRAEHHAHVHLGDDEVVSRLSESGRG